jgi:hypothetical protein
MLGCQVLDLILDQFGEERQVTRQEVGAEVSALVMAWICKDLLAKGTLTDWYFSCTAQVTMLTRLRGLCPSSN